MRNWKVSRERGRTFFPGCSTSAHAPTFHYKRFRHYARSIVASELCCHSIISHSVLTQLMSRAHLAAGYQCFTLEEILNNKYDFYYLCLQRLTAKIKHTRGKFDTLSKHFKKVTFEISFERFRIYCYMHYKDKL